MHANDKSIYGCTFAPAEFKVPDNTKLTYNPDTKRLYVHLYEYPSSGTFILPGYKGKVKYAQFLHDDSELKIKPDAGGSEDVVLEMPEKKPEYDIPVIELVLQ
jgi:alpha-L-fucosidase